LITDSTDITYKCFDEEEFKEHLKEKKETPITKAIFKKEKTIKKSKLDKIKNIFEYLYFIEYNKINNFDRFLRLQKLRIQRNEITHNTQSNHTD
jgi:hypothetical protein